MKNRPVDKFYKAIANAQKKIDAIRKKCKHKKTRMGLYSWRIGAMDNAELCNTCDAVIPNNNTVFGGMTVAPTPTVVIKNVNELNTTANQFGKISL